MTYLTESRVETCKMSLRIIVDVYVGFKRGDEEERKSTMKKPKGHFDVNMSNFANPPVFLCNLHDHTAYSSAEELLESIASFFDSTKIEVGYLDFYAYRETRFLHWPSETHRKIMGPA